MHESGLTMILFTSILTACFLNSVLVSAEPTIINDETTGGNITLVLTSEDAVVYGSFDVGDAQGLSLVIATNSDTVVVNSNLHSMYQDQSPEGVVSRGNTIIGNNYVPAYGYELYSIRMGAQTFEVTNQTVGGSPNYAFTGDGIFGLAHSPIYDNLTFPANLCEWHKLDHCRFGLALDVAGGGSLFIGDLDEASIEDPRTKASINPESTGWHVMGSITHPAAGNSEPMADQNFYIASELLNVMGPIDLVEQILTSIGATLVPTHGLGGSMPHGSYPCDTSMPELGFSLASGDSDSANQHLWPFDASAWTSTSTESGTCTAPIFGWSEMEPNTWHLGQAWLCGKYVDFNMEDKTITVATMKGSNAKTDPTDPAALLSPVKIKMQKQGSSWVVPAIVGTGNRRMLRVDTISSDLIMFPSQYESSGASTGSLPGSNGEIGPIMPCNKDLFDLTLSSDEFAVGGVAKPMFQTIVNLKDASFPEDASPDSYHGIMGLSGKKNPQLPIETKSLLDSMCEYYKFEQCKFAVALDSTFDDSITAGDTAALLFLGGNGSEYSDEYYYSASGAIPMIPVNEERVVVSNSYIENVGKWWFKGDILVGDAETAQGPFQNQDIYLDLNSDVVRELA